MGLCPKASHQAFSLLAALGWLWTVPASAHLCLKGQPRRGHSASILGMLASKGQENFPPHFPRHRLSKCCDHGPLARLWHSSSEPAGGTARCTDLAQSVEALHPPLAQPLCILCPAVCPGTTHARTPAQVISPKYLDICFLRPMPQDRGLP